MESIETGLSTSVANYHLGGKMNKILGNIQMSLTLPTPAVALQF